MKDNIREQAIKLQRGLLDNEMKTNITICSDVMQECDESLPGMELNRRSNPVLVSNPHIDRSELNTVDQRFRGMNIWSPGTTDMTSLMEKQHRSPERRTNEEERQNDAVPQDSNLRRFIKGDEKELLQNVDLSIKNELPQKHNTFSGPNQTQPHIFATTE